MNFINEVLTSYSLITANHTRRCGAKQAGRRLQSVGFCDGPAFAIQNKDCSQGSQLSANNLGILRHVKNVLYSENYFTV